ncbi:hypothetical protein KAW38_00920 [Candidatus Micrarchaeota archaeon]|nr:hypothetical protein [Candidatus Micrarchaeota archaeon]
MRFVFLIIIIIFLSIGCVSFKTEADCSGLLPGEKPTCYSEVAIGYAYKGMAEEAEQACLEIDAKEYEDSIAKCLKKVAIISMDKTICSHITTEFMGGIDKDKDYYETTRTMCLSEIGEKEYKRDNPACISFILFSLPFLLLIISRN